MGPAWEHARNIEDVVDGEESDTRTIFFVAVYESERPYRAGGNRTWGWYETFEEAERAVLENHTDIFECTYDYAVIEEVGPGVMALGEVRQWYRADFKNRNPPGGHSPTVTRCDPPAFAEGTCNLCIG